MAVINKKYINKTLYALSISYRDVIFIKPWKKNWKKRVENKKKIGIRKDS